MRSFAYAAALSGKPHTTVVYLPHAQRETVPEVGDHRGLRDP